MMQFEPKILFPFYLFLEIWESGDWQTLFSNFCKTCISGVFLGGEFSKSEQTLKDHKCGKKNTKHTSKEITMRTDINKKIRHQQE